MPVDGSLYRRFEALKNRAAQLAEHYAEHHPKKIIDPVDMDPLIDRWIALYTELRDADPEVDVVPSPTRPPKFDNQSAYGGRGGYDPEELRRIRSDMDEVWTIVMHPSKQAPQLTIGREGIFVGGKGFDAMMAVHSIITSAKDSIVLIDAYVGVGTLQLLGFKAEAVRAEILTYKVDPTFVHAAKTFVTQHKHLEVRTSNAFHDRFLAIDDRHYFHFGTSIKDAALKNTFMFSLIEEQVVVAALHTAISDAWGKATPVAL